ncbi:MAG: hypothetical protein H7Y28_05395 [Rhodoferax sp.]|nr:hypothetical protein [Rhodoferax sp.]
MRVFVLFQFLAVFSTALLAAECPFIRPPGLSPQQVDAIVFGTYAHALGMRPEALDTKKTLKKLDRTDNAILTYSFATLSVGEKLGFDAIQKYFDAAKAKGASHPFDSLSVYELAGLARAEYAKGVDANPPAAAEKMVFKVDKLIVKAPVQVEGWHLLRCGSEDVTFQRQSAGNVSTATVRVAGLPPYKSNAEFLALVKSMWAAAIPAGSSVGSWEPTIAASKEPCADARIKAVGPTGTIFMRSRICYASTKSNYGYVTLYSNNTSKSNEALTVEAEAFVVGNSPQ